MFELRRLRLGERPVTGQDNRERIQTFLNNAQDHRQDVRVPSTRPPAPSARIADINALTNRRCVSVALGSTAFRQDLENTIRRTIGVSPATPSQSIPQAPTPPQPLASINVQQQPNSQVIQMISQPSIQQQQQQQPNPQVIQMISQPLIQQQQQQRQPESYNVERYIYFQTK